MFTYVALIKLTPEGREGLKEAPKYLEKIKFFVEEQKGELDAPFAMMGPWDFFAIVKYPTVEAAFQAHARIAGARGDRGRDLPRRGSRAVHQGARLR